MQELFARAAAVETLTRATRTMINEHPLLAERLALVHVQFGGRHMDVDAAYEPLNQSARWPFAAYVYNPAVLDPVNVLLKISPFTFCLFNRSNASMRSDLAKAAFARGRVFERYTVWLQRSRVRTVVWHAEDARPFLLGGHV
eukprot:185406-Prymnesium_polylepis.2